MKKIVSQAWNILTKKERRHFLRLLSFDILVSMLDIAFLAFLLGITQFYIEPGSEKSFVSKDWLLQYNPVAVVAVFLVAFAAKNAAGYFISAAHYRFNGDVALRITRKNLAAYQQAEFGEFVHTDSSVHIRRINLQPFEFCQYILSGMQQVSTQFFLVALSITAILLFNAQLFFLLLCILLPPVAGVFYFIKRKLNRARQHIRSGNEQSYRYLLDALKGYPESNMDNRHVFFMERYMRERKKFGKYLFESINIQNLPPRVIEIFAVLGLFILVVLAEWSGNNSHSYFLTIGAFMAAAYKIIPGLVKIINTTGQMKTFSFSGGDFVPEEKTATLVSAVNPLSSVEFKNISFSYNGKNILKNLSFEIKPGDFIGVSGPSGLGKTTLLNLLTGFLSQDTGEIKINDRVSCKETISNYRSQIAYVRQQAFLLHDSLLKNITLEEEIPAEKNLYCALQASGLDKFKMDQLIAENGKNISGGQQQRVALARAFYKNANLILLDEPFNELDNFSVKHILRYLQAQTQQGKMVVLITHDTQHFIHCSKIISLHGN